jgi:Mg2+/Co2+ transporter CorC
MNMNRNTKTLIFMATLAIGVDSLWSQSGAGSLPAPPSETQARAQQRIREQEQRSLLQHCRSMAELARDHTSELLRGATRGRSNLETMQPHLREVRSALDSMLEDHRRLLYSVTEEQWTAAKDPITALERLRGSIQTQIQGIDLELQMPAPDSKVLIRYEKKLRALLKEWRRQHRRMAASIGVSL